MNDLRQRDVNGVVINASQLKREGDGLAEFLQKPTHVRLNRVQALNLLVIVHEHVTVDLVDEDFVNDIRFNLASLLDQIPQTHACALVVRLVRVDDIDQGTALLNLAD